VDIYSGRRAARPGTAGSLKEAVMAGLSDWARVLLDGRRHAVLATANDDGSIHQTPVWYLFRNGELFVGSTSASRKVKNVVARPTASLVVDVRLPGRERWVSGSGPVAILSGAESQAIVAAIQQRYLTPEAMGHPQIGPGFAAADDVTLVITPTSWRSWASADLDAQFFGGLLSASPDKWFRPVDE
jgi:PPOX class probable F420-dependent enzyme